MPLVIWRAGKKLTLNVVLGELELAEKDNLIGLNNNKVTGKSKSFDKLGFVGEELSDTNINKYKLNDIKSGIVITAVKPESSAEKAGLIAGMVIVRVGQIEVKSLKVIDDAIKNAKSGQVKSNFTAC